MPQKLTIRGDCQDLAVRALGRVTFQDVDEQSRSDYFRIVTKNSLPSSDDLRGYAAGLTEIGADYCIPQNFPGPRVRYGENLSFISSDSILAINPDGHTRILFRPESRNNTIFTTVE